MKSEKILEMLNNNEIELLKSILMEEIYNKNLGAGRKERYAAMKKYYRFSTGNRKPLLMPCKIGNEYAFIDGFTAVLTSEDCGEIALYNEGTDGKFFDVNSLFRRSENTFGKQMKINFTHVLAEAKSKGYKFKKDAVNHVLKLRDGYFNIKLIDQAYSIISDGEDAEVTYNGNKGAMVIKTSIGKCLVLPVNFAPGGMENITIIEAMETK